MKQSLSAQTWPSELHARWARVLSSVRSVGAGAVLVEKVGVGAVDCVCAEEHRARRDGRWPALTLLMDVRPRQHSFASCKKLLIILDLCEGRSCSCGRLVVASLCPVCVRVCVRGCVCVCAGVHWPPGAVGTWVWHMLRGARRDLGVVLLGAGDPWSGAHSGAGRESC